MDRRIIIVGATSAIAQQCARIWLREGPARLELWGRDAGRLERVAADLRVRAPGSLIEARVVDFLDPSRISESVRQAADTGAPDLVLIAQGSLPDQERCQRELGCAADALQVNGLSPVLFAEAFATVMEAAHRGTLILIGSVAGDRGRKKNYVYGAGKALLDRYAEGLQHRLAGTNVTVVLVKPGPTDTPMTAHLAGARLASPEVVAERIVDGAGRGRPVIYAPPKWRLIMLVLRHLPRFIFNRLDI